VSAKQELETFVPNSKNSIGNKMNLISYLKNNKVWFKIIEKHETVHTADAAAATGIPLERVTKSLVFLDENKTPILAIIPGNCVANKKKLKDILAVKNIELAPFEEAEKYSGYEPGATCPVFHKNIKKVVMDQKVMQHETVFGGGGSRKKLIELKPEDIKKLNNAIVADISEVKKF
jgi:Cys-tRNA(Pro) deacylase